MRALAQTERRPGRWVLIPEKDERFLGERGRAYVRARDRRRFLFTLLVEATGLTALIGIAPPLRAIWLVTLVLSLGLAGYCLWLMKLKDEFESMVARTVPKRAVPVAEEPALLENELAFVAPVVRLDPKPAFGYPSIPPDVSGVRVITLEEALHMEASKARALAR